MGIGLDADDDGRQDRRTLFGMSLMLAVLALLALGFDRALTRLLNPSATNSLVPLLRWFDDPAPRWSMTVMLVMGFGAMLLGRRDGPRRRAGLTCVLGFVVVLVITQSLKVLVARARPMLDPALAATIWSPLGLADHESFPSGHVSGAAAIAGGLWLLAGRGRLRHLLWLFPLIQCGQRVALGAHWMSDALAAFAIGCAGCAVTHAVAQWPLWDLVLARLHRPSGAGSARAVYALGFWLLLTRIWGARALGCDPVSGVVVPGFETHPHWQRVAAEIVMGPALWSARVPDVAAFARWSVAWVAALIALLVLIAVVAHRAWPVRLAVVVTAVAGSAALLFWRGWVVPDRFAAPTDRPGIFVDWHLHGDDPSDGHLSAEALSRREAWRGVSWAVMTHHSHLAPDPGRLAAGVAGIEWSGRGPLNQRRDTPWDTPHVLILGAPGLVEVCVGEADALSAIRTAKRLGGVAIVAHHWLSAGQVPVPSVAEYVAAGASGFEVGNRQRQDAGPPFGRLGALDQTCRSASLWRVSFSDDHGIPGGSPCVTFLEGVTPEALAQEGGASVLARLSGGGPGAPRILPLVFDGASGEEAPPAWLAPVVELWRYFCSLRGTQRLAWFFEGAILSWWALRQRRIRS